MADTDYDLYDRFHTPDPNIAERERAAMSPEEKAWALYKGSVHRSGWLEWAILPVVIGLWLPTVCIVLVLLAYQALFAPGFDPQQHGEAIFTAMQASTVLLLIGWVAWNRHRARRDPRLLYWLAEIELERHTLVSAFSLWSSDYDPDNPQVARWADGRIQQVADSGVVQWLLALSETGHWLSRGDLDRLTRIAHHWTFFAPERYAQVNPLDVPWVEALWRRAQSAAVDSLPSTA